MPFLKVFPRKVESDQLSGSFRGVGAMSGVKPERLTSTGAGRGRRSALWIVGTLVSAAVLMFCYVRIAGATQVNSDGAGMVLEARDILHGNLLLHGWWATDVSFYTTELPAYVGVTALAGLHPQVVHIVSALAYTLLVLLAAFVARGRGRGGAGMVGALIAAGVILAPQPTGPTQVLLGSPDHVGTGVPVLLLLLLLDWARPRWYIPVCAGVLVAWAIVGDPLVEVVGALPLFLACLIRAARVVWSRRAPATADAGTGPEGQAPPPRLSVPWVWSVAWYELSLAAAAVVAVPAALLATKVLAHLGGIQVAGATYHLLSLHKIVSGLPMAARSVFALFGADYHGVSGTGNHVFAYLHLIGVAVVFFGFVLGAWRLVRPGARLLSWRSRGAGDAAQPGDLVTDILVLAIAANFAAFLIEIPKPNIYTAHEIGPVLGLGAALAGRTLGGLIAGRQAQGSQVPGDHAPGSQAAAAGLRGRWSSWSRPRRVVLSALAAGLACYIAMLGYAAAHSQAAPRNVGLTAWLAKHHLKSGLAPYWESSSVTVDSGGKVTVLTVEPAKGKKYLVPRKWQADVLLAKPAKGRAANFVIMSPAENVSAKIVLATFGKPAAKYRYGPFTIWVWHKNLLIPLAHPPKPAHTSTVDVTRPDGSLASRGADRSPV
jgi:hypothetical protein